MKCAKNDIFTIVTYGILVFPFCSLADQSIMVRDDFGVGIKSQVYISIGNTNVAKGVTDDSGVLLLEDACKQGKQIKASPVTPLYYAGFVDCHPNQPQLIVQVTKKVFASNLKWNAEYLQTTGKTGDAALVYSELATRLNKVDVKEAGIARMNAYKSFANAIETPRNLRVVGFDKKQGASVLTPEFVDILKEYQNLKGLPVTGAIDYKTLSTQSNISIGEVLSKKVAPISDSILER